MKTHPFTHTATDRTTSSPNIHLPRRTEHLQQAAKHRVDISGQSKPSLSLSACEHDTVSASDFLKITTDTHDVYGERTERKEKDECGERPRFGESECSHGRER